MSAIREETKPFIWWQIKASNSNFLLDNWIKLGALYYIEGDVAEEGDTEVKDFIREDLWDENLLKETISAEVTNYIVHEIKLDILGTKDKAWCLGCSSGTFTVKNAYQLLRHRKEQMELAKMLWVKGLLYKILFFL